MLRLIPLRLLPSLCLSLVAVVALMAASTASAIPVYGTSAAGELNGSRSVDGGGLDGYNAYAEDFTVTWAISLSGSTWHYEYVFTGLDGSGREKAISHLVVDISDDCTGADCVFNVSPAGTVEFGNKDGITGAVKFDFGGGEGFTISFDSNRAPVYGHLAVKGGGGSDTCAAAAPSSNVACNVGLHLTAGDVREMDSLNYIARPNGITVPEPTTAVLLGLGVVSAGLLRRKD